jgi:hypothetical protein
MEHLTMRLRYPYPFSMYNEMLRTRIVCCAYPPSSTILVMRCPRPCSPPSGSLPSSSQLRFLVFRFTSVCAWSSSKSTICNADILPKKDNRKSLHSDFDSVCP